MVASLGAAHCGPGTSWDKTKNKCLPLQRAEMDIQTCKPFTHGVRYEGAHVGSHQHALNASHCARVCLDKFHAENFTFKEGTRDCYCYNDSTPKAAQEYPTCEIHDGAIRVMCNADVVASYSNASYSNGSEQKALEACNLQAARGQLLKCNVNISGQTCNAEPTCDPKSTKVVDGRCVASNAADSMPVRSLKNRVRISDADCVVGAPAAAPIPVKTEAECTRRCEISDRCHASTYDAELKRCSLVDACPMLRGAKGKATTFHTRSASPEHCGPGTRFDMTTQKCVLNASTHEQLADSSSQLKRIAEQKNECEARLSETKTACASFEKDADRVKVDLLAKLNKCDGLREACSAFEKDSEKMKTDLEEKLMVAVGGAASAEKQALQMRVQLADANKKASESNQKLIATQTELRNLATAIASGTSTATNARMLAIQELAKPQV